MYITSRSTATVRRSCSRACCLASSSCAPPRGTSTRPRRSQSPQSALVRASLTLSSYTFAVRGGRPREALSGFGPRPHGAVPLHFELVGLDGAPVVVAPGSYFWYAGRNIARQGASCAVAFIETVGLAPASCRSRRQRLFVLVTPQFFSLTCDVAKALQLRGGAALYESLRRVNVDCDLTTRRRRFTAGDRRGRFSH